MAKTDKDMLDDQMLDAFFDAARSEVTEPSAGLVSAILADAAAHQPGAAGRGVSDGRDTRQQPNVWSRITSAIGGWPALGQRRRRGADAIRAAWCCLANTRPMKRFTPWRTWPPAISEPRF